MGLPGAGIEGQGGVPPWSLLSETGSAKEADARVKMGTVMERVIKAKEGEGREKQTERQNDGERLRW